MGQHWTVVSDGAWAWIEPLLPSSAGRRGRWRDHRQVIEGIVFRYRTGCARRNLPAEFGVSKATAHRRFVAWTQAGLWRRLHRAVLDRLGAQAAIDWSRAVVDAGQRAGEKKAR